MKHSRQSVYRVVILGFIIIFFLSLLSWRFYYLQVQAHQIAETEIRRQSVRQIVLPGARGQILSQDGATLANNLPIYTLSLYIHELRKPSHRQTIQHVLETIKQIEEIVGRPSLLRPLSSTIPHLSENRQNWVNQIKKIIDPLPSHSSWKKTGENVILLGSIEAIQEWLLLYNIHRHLYYYPMIPLKIFENLKEYEIARIMERVPPLPGVEIGTTYQRIYPLGQVGAHLIGFVGQRNIIPSTPEEDRNIFFLVQDLTGKSGLEAVFDSYLLGKSGMKGIHVASIGFYVQTEWEEEPVAGHDIILTIDSRLQIEAQRLLEGYTGAIVCMDIHTGYVMAMVSSPSFDPNQIRTYYKQWANDPERPLLNRALVAETNPGSIIKPLVALAALHYQVLNPQTTYPCYGYYAIGNTRIHCHQRSGHGELELIQAMSVSCNPFFIHLGTSLGAHRLVNFYKYAGLGQAPKLEIENRFSQGTLLDPDKTPLHLLPIETAYLSIGQGKITISPLQSACYTAAIANGGKLMRPQLLYAIRNHQGKTIFISKPEIRGYLPSSLEELTLIRESMYQVVHGPFGTAKICRTPTIAIAGKTGTAERQTGDRKWNDTWFIGFAPYEHPRWSVAVLIEEGTSGGTTAAPIARALFEYMAKLFR